MSYSYYMVKQRFKFKTSYSKFSASFMSLLYFQTILGAEEDLTDWSL